MRKLTQLKEHYGNSALMAAGGTGAPLEESKSTDLNSTKQSSVTNYQQQQDGKSFSKYESIQLKISKDMSYGLMTHHGYRKYGNKTVMHSKQQDGPLMAEWDERGGTNRTSLVDGGDSRGGTTAEITQTDGGDSTRMSSRQQQ